MGIEFRNVSKVYEDGTEAVRNFSLRIASHTCMVLLGSSGCGKTTLLRMVNRMVDPSSGQVFIDDDDVADTNPVNLRRSIGYVMQNAGLLPHRRVVDNVGTVLRLNGAGKAEARERARELLDMVGLDQALGDRYPDQLSGGQQQSVGVARGLAANPNILLMDEPFGAVDPLVRLDLQHELMRLQSDLRKTILFVTHDIDEALTLGDQIAVLRTGGEIAQMGSPQDIIENPVDDFVARFVGVENGRRTLSANPRPAGGWSINDSTGRPLGIISQLPRERQG